MARKKVSELPLEQFANTATEKGMSYGKYMQYLYREECRKKREKEAKCRAKSRKAGK